MVSIAIAVAVVVRLIAILLSAAALVLHVEGRGLPPGIALVIMWWIGWSVGVIVVIAITLNASETMRIVVVGGRV